MKTVHVSDFESVLSEIKTYIIESGWEILDDLPEVSESIGRTLVFKSPKDYIGTIREYKKASVGKLSLIVNHMIDYNPSLDAFSQDVSIVENDTAYLNLHNNVMSLFMFSNDYRLYFVIKAENRYMDIHLGLSLRYGVESDYKYPFITGCGGYSSYPTLSIRQNSRLITDNGGDLFYSSSSAGYRSINSLLEKNYVYNTSRSLETLNSGYDMNGNIILSPVLIANDGNKYVSEFSDIYRISSSYNIVSENTLTVDSIDYVVFQINGSTIVTVKK